MDMNQTPPVIIINRNKYSNRTASELASLDRYCEMSGQFIGIFIFSGYKRLMLEPRQREVVRTLWEQGRLSRWELHERTGLTPNNVGSLADTLLKQGVLRECAPESSGAGRPRVPLEIDPARRYVVGLAIAPGKVEAGRVGLRGTPIGSPVSKTVEEPAKLIPAAASV